MTALQKREERVIRMFKRCVERESITAEYAMILIENSQAYGWMSAEAREEFGEWIDAFIEARDGTEIEEPETPEETEDPEEAEETAEEPAEEPEAGAEDDAEDAGDEDPEGNGDGENDVSGEDAEAGSGDGAEEPEEPGEGEGE